MKIYSFKRLQILQVSAAKAWEFFSSPANLGLITPKHMVFNILYSSGGGQMYPGQIIRYRIGILPGLKVEWVTEITHVLEPYFFVDEQRSGPFALWHHQHTFRAVENGVEVTDEVNYSVPYGLAGRLVNHLFVERQVNAIFDYRAKALADHFSNNEATTNSR